MRPAETAGDWIGLPEEKGGAARELYVLCWVLPVVFSKALSAPSKRFFWRIHSAKADVGLYIWAMADGESGLSRMVLARSRRGVPSCFIETVSSWPASSMAR